MAPVTGLTGTASLYSKANVELGHLFGLMDSLEKGATETTTAEAASAFASFQTIALEGITFRYEKGGFATGPWDLRLRRGELLYLRGGNGAGKSTALKVICGLYRPESGTVRVDGQPVTDASLQSYRELFSAIFTDFHLFERLYGLENVSPDRVQELLHRMQLASKVTFQDGRFSTLDLSTGQRKRLAMIVSLLEDRPIFIFDEWAADQDAHFREHFYTELVPELLLRGKTVLIVSHDDRYWRPEDRVVTVDLGALHESVSRPS
jgi:putative ATP-binding cassette transporter